MKSNQLKSGVILSYINLGLGTIIPFFYTPIMLRMLGQSEYGLYSLATSVISYLSLLSFGFGSTITRYISVYIAEGDKKAEEAAFGFFLFIYCIFAFGVAICGAVITGNTDKLFQRGLASSEVTTMKSLLMIMTFNAVISFPNSVFSSVIIAHERYVFSKILDLCSTVAVPILNLLSLYLGFASIGMAFVGLILQLFILFINIFYCLLAIKVKPVFTKLPKPLIVEMIRFSAFAFMGTLVDLLFWSTDKVILGMLSGSLAVAIYNIGSTFNSIVISMSTSISGVFTPRITGMIIKKASKKELTDLFVRIGRIQFIVIGLIISGFIAFGRSFIYLWAGSEYSGAYWVAILTLIPLSVPLIQNIGLSIITAQNKHKFRSIVYLAIAILNVVSTYIVVPYFGIYGAALCSCVSYIIGQVIIMNWYYYKVIGLNIPLFWKNISKMAVIPTIMCVITSFILMHINLSNWIKFITAVLIYLIAYVLLMKEFAFNDYERGIINKKARKLINSK